MPITDCVGESIGATKALDRRISEVLVLRAERDRAMGALGKAGDC